MRVFRHDVVLIPFLFTLGLQACSTPKTTVSGRISDSKAQIEGEDLVSVALKVDAGKDEIADGGYPLAESLRDSIAQLEEDVADQEALTPEAVAEENEKENARIALEKIPLDMNEDVERWIKYFAEKDRERFQRFLDRGSQYRDVVQSMLEENGLPTELYYLAMIESGYKTRATSRAKAAGVWQFISATGKRYGLQVDRYADERRDPIRATESAAKYLKDLYNVFGSWHLAMAAYNAGEYRIVRAVVRGKSRDFWTLVKMRVLPRETANYVPKFLAALTIGENLEKYGFQEPKGEKYPDLEVVEVPSPVRLKDVAKLFGISLAELKRVNPHLHKEITPPNQSVYEVWMPEQFAKKFSGNATEFKAQLAKLKIKNFRGSRYYASTNGRHYHRVRRGENLGLIAGKYKISVAYLKRLNGLRSNVIHPGKRLRVTARSYHAKNLIRYRVRRGDSLIRIAKRFGVSVGSLKRVNSLRRNRIFIGQTLRINSPGT